MVQYVNYSIKFSIERFVKHPQEKCVLKRMKRLSVPSRELYGIL